MIGSTLRDYDRIVLERSERASAASWVLLRLYPVKRPTWLPEGFQAIERPEPEFRPELTLQGRSPSE